jgi:hypothetical protein
VTVAMSLALTLSPQGAITQAGNNGIHAIAVSTEISRDMESLRSNENKLSHGSGRRKWRQVESRTS